MTRPTPPRLFDEAALRLHAARAARQGAPPDFLLQRAMMDLEDRLAVVMRSFDHSLDLATPLPHVAAFLSARGTHITRLMPPNSAAEYGDWVTREAPFDNLALAPESLDLVVSLLALHTVDDLPGTLIQIRRALKPDGLFIACLLGGDTLTELRQSFLEAETLIEGGASPRVAPFADIRDCGALLQRAGFTLPVTDVDHLVVRYADPFHLMRDLRAMGATNPLMDRRRNFLRRATLMKAAEIYAERFSDPDGRIRATFDLIWMSGWAPHESQQKPLKPGSAKMSLAEALKPKSSKP
jgi:SAM-dependent methyltransferase